MHIDDGNTPTANTFTNGPYLDGGRVIPCVMFNYVEIPCSSFSKVPPTTNRPGLPKLSSTSMLNLQTVTFSVS